MLVGLDLSHCRLLEGSRRFQRLTFVVGDGMALPFRAGAFDAVLGHVSLPYMNTRTALREIYRVLAQGGVCFLTLHSFAYVRGRFLDDFRQNRLKDIVFLLYITTNGLLNHCGLPQLPWFRGRFETFNTAAGVARTARNIGFTAIRTETQRGVIFFGVTGQKSDPLARERPPEMEWSLATVIRGNDQEPAVHNDSMRSPEQGKGPGSRL
jgi:ubiquinone/menaquinone biosynthesis C-methylase UbiE